MLIFNAAQTAQYLSDRVAMKVVHRSNLRMGMLFACYQCGDFLLLLQRDFTGRVSSAAIHYIAPLCFSISHVIGMSAKKQVKRVDAARIITGMKHLQSIGDGTAIQFPRKMRAKHEFAVDANLTVAICIEAGSPIPAFKHAVGFYFFPESKNRIAFSGHTTPRQVLVRHGVRSQGGDETAFSGATLDHSDNYSTECA